MASSNLIGDITSVYNNGPNAATLAKAIAPAGPILDYPGNTKSVLLHFQETTVLLGKIITDTDSTDSTNLTLLNGIQAALLGTGSPSTHVITDIKTVYTNGPNAATQTKAIAVAGPIMDYVGNTEAVKKKLQESSTIVTRLVTDTDSTDSTNLTLLNGIASTLS